MRRDILVYGGDRRELRAIDWQNLVNFGILPLVFDDERAYEQCEVATCSNLPGLGIKSARLEVVATNVTRGAKIATRHQLSGRQIEVLLAGGLINWVKQQRNLEASR